MAREWARHCREDKRLQVDGDDVVITFGNGRTQKVRVRPEDDGLVLETVVAKAAAVEAEQANASADFEAWKRNRRTKLIHHWVDRRQRLCARAVLPTPAPSSEEFLLHLMALAEAADRWELHLTGEDAY